MVMKKKKYAMAYVADEAAMEEQAKFRKILQKLNFADRSDFDGIAKIAKELLANQKTPALTHLLLQLWFKY